MSPLTRRGFVQLAGAACLTGSTGVSAPAAFASAQPSAPPIRLGVVARVPRGGSPRETIARVHQLGFSTCQTGFSEPVAPAAVQQLKEALAEFHIEGTAMLAAMPGADVYNFYDGPLTIGIVPPATRRIRIDALKATADMAAVCGIPAVHTHCGFVPENPNDPLYQPAVQALREVAEHCKQQGRLFYCETGQETPITLLRFIEDAGMDNVFVNLDVANFILYDKANPVDAMDVLGTRVRGMHAKDGLFPTDPRNLGKEVPIGQGKVDFRRFIQRLRDVNYQGAMTIEREIHGPQQGPDILASKTYLEKMIAEVYSTPSGSNA
jgi:L-ribulose-5-phosphate 3-epimerase